MDYTVDSFVNKMLKAIICIAFLMMVSGAVLFRSYYAIGFALGVGMSLALNVGKVLWLKYAVNRATVMEPGAAGAYISIHYVLRYILTGLVLVAAHFLPVVSMFGAAIGLLSMPFANYAVHFINRGNKQDDLQTAVDAGLDDTANDAGAVPDDSENNSEEEQTP